jgi:hypothetical protein
MRGCFSLDQCGFAISSRPERRNPERDGSRNILVRSNRCGLPNRRNHRHAVAGFSVRHCVMTPKNSYAPVFRNVPRASAAPNFIVRVSSVNVWT